MEEEKQDPRMTYIAIKEGLEYMIHQLIDVVDHLDRGLDQNLVEDPDWHAKLMEMGNFMALANQMQVQMLPDNEKEQLRRLMMGDDDPSTERR